MVEPYVVPGVSTEALDRICHDHIVIVQGAIPANVGYQGYPKTILTSVNHVVCHGIPLSPIRTRNGQPLRGHPDGARAARRRRVAARCHKLLILNSFHCDGELPAVAVKNDVSY